MIDATVIIVDARKEPHPLGPWFAVIHKRSRAILAGPMVMRHYVTQTYIVALHQHGRKFCGAVPSTEVIMPTAFALAHFDTD